MRGYWLGRRTTSLFRQLVLVLCGAALFLWYRSAGSGPGEKPDAVPVASLLATADEDIRHRSELAVSGIIAGPAERRREAAAYLSEQGPRARAYLRTQFERATGWRRGALAFALAFGAQDADRKLIAEAFAEDGSDTGPLLALAAAELGDPALAGGFLPLRGSSDPLVREAAARGLRHRPAAGLADLIPLLTDAVPAVRDAAQDSVARLLARSAPAAARHEIEDALDSSSPLTRVAGLRLCANVIDSWAITLACKATRDPVWYVREEAIETIVRLGDGRASWALARLAERGASAREKKRAILALGGIDASPNARDALARVADADGADPALAVAAAYALALRRDVRCMPALLRLRQAARGPAWIRLFADRVLLRLATTRPRARRESWTRWWLRARRDYHFPFPLSLPEFPR